MDFGKLKEQFLKNKRRKERTSTYESSINILISYAETQYTLSFEQDKLVKEMNTQFIINGLDYYLNLKKGADREISKQEYARKYFQVIGQLFEFIFTNAKSKYKIQSIDIRTNNPNKNTVFFQALANPYTRDNSYKKDYSHYIETNKNLLPKESMQMLTEETVSKLVLLCDDEIEKKYKLLAKDIKSELPKKGHFHRLAACICIKLMLLTGIKYNVARELKSGIIDIERGVIFINDFEIPLPNKMIPQIANYLMIKEKTPSVYFFSRYNGEQWSEVTSSSTIPDFLSNTFFKKKIPASLCKDFNKSSIMAIGKFAISQLLQKGINIAFIQQFTGYKDEVIMDCIEENTSFYSENITKLAETKIYKSLQFENK